MSYSEDILGLQNPDGGWSYRRGGSWTEPTCLALLGLTAAGNQDSEAVDRGTRWLARCQRSDGGFAPRESVQESVWVSALALLLPSSTDQILDRPKATSWLMDQTGRESGGVNRLRLWMLGVQSQDSISFRGWPWYPGTAAWVAPTAFSILALQKAGKTGDPTIRERVEQGRSFLLARRCRDDGWNHGSTRALGYDSDSYPETTGLGLLALHGVKGREVDSAIRRAESHLAACQSSEAESWLRLALIAHGRVPKGPELQPRNGTIPLALAEIAKASTQGRQILADAHA